MQFHRGVGLLGDHPSQSIERGFQKTMDCQLVQFV